MNKQPPSPETLARLERLRRERFTEFHFLRESPREQRGIPFASDYDHMPYPRLARAVFSVGRWLGFGR